MEISIPETGQKRPSVCESTLPTGRETILGKRATYSQRTEANCNEQHCLSDAHGSQPNHVQLNFSVERCHRASGEVNTWIKRLTPNQFLFVLGCTYHYLIHSRTSTLGLHSGERIQHGLSWSHNRLSYSCNTCPQRASCNTQNLTWWKATLFFTKSLNEIPLWEYAD